MRRRIIAVAVAGFVLLANSAQAREAETDFALAFMGGLGLLVGTVHCLVNEDEGSDYAREGLYLGLGGSYAIEEVVKLAGLTADNGGGVNARAGYRCNPLAAVEFAYEWIGGIDGSLGATDFSLDRHMFTANAKAHLLTGRIQPYLLAGLGVMRSDRPASYGQLKNGVISSTNTQTELAPRLGGGIDVYATENAVVSFESSYVRGVYKLRGYDHFTLGLGFQYRF